MTKLLTFIILLLAISLNCFAQEKKENVPTPARQAITDGYKKYKDSDFVGAAKYWEKALPLVEKYGGAYEFLLQALSSAYSESGDRQNFNRIMALTEDHNQHELIKPCDEPDCMMERAHYYSVKGDMAMARECFLKTFTMKLTSEQEFELYKAYAEFIGLDNKDYGGAADYFLSIANGQEGSQLNNETIANLYYYAGSFAFIAKNYDLSIKSFQSALDLYSSAMDSIKDPEKIIKSLKTLGFTYSAEKNIQKSIECYSRLVDFYEKTDTITNDYPKALLRLGKEEKFNKSYASSIRHHLKSMSIFDQRGMAEDYTDAARSLQLCYLYAGIEKKVDIKEDAAEVARKNRLDQIIQHEKEKLNIIRTYHGKASYAQSLGTIAGSYKEEGDLVNSVKYYKLYIPILRDAVRERFRLNDANSRMRFWNDIQHTNIREIKSLLQSEEIENGPLAADANSIVYDTELLSKGILLNSSIEFEKVLYGLHKEKLIEIYTRLKANEEHIADMRKNVTSKDSLDSLLAMTRQNEELQLKLYRGCAEYADFTNYISYTWQDVQKQLKDGDIAIEFVLAGDSPLEKYNKMMALVLTNNSKAPEAIIVNEDSVWVGLQPWLASAKRIFFSADGNLNRIAIEYMPYGGKPISEQFEVYRLSSTKELCYKHNAKPYTNAAIFGDINYNEDGTMTDNTKRSLKSLQTREGGSSYADLSNTKREINDITTILKTKGVKKVVELSDTEASRDAFMKLDNSKIDVLHVATHGTYKDVKKSTDADAMNNSILAFAGANLDKSGLVTAADIAKMNLRQCDLAVLSACETGLGKLSGDGVFGLQRGFKNAGVHTLLMSLRDVYDNTTADMMISFYRYLMNGSTKREALIKAQKDVRESGHTDPKFWATFILLDAID